MDFSPCTAASQPGACQSAAGGVRATRAVGCQSSGGGGVFAVAEAMVYRAIAQTPAPCAKPKTVIKGCFSRQLKTQVRYLLLIHRLAACRITPPNMDATFGAATLVTRCGSFLKTEPSIAKFR